MILNYLSIIICLSISIYVISCYTIKDEFLLCKVCNTSIDPAFACLNERLSEYNCSDLRTIMNNYITSENEFNLLRNFQHPENFNVFYISNKNLFLCDCNIINKIEVPDEVDKPNDYCIRDIFIHFNGMNGFLTQFGIIKEKTDSIKCDNIPRYYYSLTKMTEFIQLNNKIMFKQFVSPKHEKLVQHKQDEIIELKDLDKQLKELKELEELELSDGVISDTNNDILALLTFGLIAIGMIILVLRYFGFKINSEVKTYGVDMPQANNQPNDQLQMISYEKFEESLNKMHNFLQNNQHENSQIIELNEIQKIIKNIIENDYRNLFEILTKNEKEKNDFYATIEDKINQLNKQISGFTIEISENRSASTQLKANVEEVVSKISELSNNQSVLNEIKEFINNLEIEKLDSKRKAPLTRSKKESA